MPTAYLSVKNFARFQHYKDRSPPWIKLYNDLLDDYAFGCLQDASKLHLVLIWLLASRMENQVPADPEWIARRINATDPVDLQVLVDAGFLIVASGSLADCKQSACLEGEGETEREKNKEQKTVSEETERCSNVENSIGAVLAPLIREHLYIGGKPDKGWNTGRDITIAKQFIDRGECTLEQWTDVIPIAREALMLGREMPMDLRIFNVKDRHDRLQTCLALLRKRRKPDGPQWGIHLGVA